MLRPLIIASTALAALASPAVAQSSDRPASIPFVSFGNIDDFHADGDRGVWLRNRQHHWYYATMVGPCLGLPFAQRIGVDTRFGGNSLDSSGVLLVDGQRCHIGELTESAGPPKKVKKPKKG
jgi:hypothetical protein